MKRTRPAELRRTPGKVGRGNMAGHSDGLIEEPAESSFLVFSKLLCHPERELTQSPSRTAGPLAVGRMLSGTQGTTVSASTRCAS